MACIKLVFVLCVVVVAPLASEAVIICGTVAANLGPCLNYLKNGGAVPPGCCNGIRALYNAAKTTAYRRTVCGCLKRAAGSIPGINLGNAAGVPGKCDVNLPYKISLSSKCNDIN